MRGKETESAREGEIEIEAERGLQRLTEAERERSTGSCKEMHRQLGRQRQGEIHTETDR